MHELKKIPEICDFGHVKIHNNHSSYLKSFEIQMKIRIEQQRDEPGKYNEF